MAAISELPVCATLGMNASCEMRPAPTTAYRILSHRVPLCGGLPTLPWFPQGADAVNRVTAGDPRLRAVVEGASNPQYILPVDS